jgi:hypothetical protein
MQRAREELLYRVRASEVRAAAAEGATLREISVSDTLMARGRGVPPADLGRLAGGPLQLSAAGSDALVPLPPPPFPY